MTDTQEAPAASPADLAQMLEGLAAIARASDEPVTLAAGTFAVYPTPDGALMLVMQVDEGPMASPEPQRARVPANLIKAMAALAGGSKSGAVKALFGK